jgi:hypothetical protein
MLVKLNFVYDKNMIAMSEQKKYGESWTQNDWVLLKKYLKEDKTSDEISKLMCRTSTSITAAEKRLLITYATENKKSVVDSAKDLNIKKASIIKTVSGKLPVSPPIAEVNPSMIYRGNIDVSVHSLNKVIIKTDSTETELRYPNIIDEFECLSQVFVTLLKHTNPGIKIILTTLSVDLDDCGKGVDKDRSFNNKMNGSELMCYALYKTASEIYDISNYIWE